MLFCRTRDCEKYGAKDSNLLSNYVQEFRLICNSGTIKNPKKIHEIRKLMIIHDHHFVEWKNGGRKSDINLSLKIFVFVPRNLD
jgi:hypothetical protein